MWIPCAPEDGAEPMSETVKAGRSESAEDPDRGRASEPTTASTEAIRDALRRTAPAVIEATDHPAPGPGPADRLERSRDAHVEQLDRERQRLIDRLEQSQALVDRLGPENARLEEALGNAVAHGVLATVYVVIGGGALCVATFIAQTPRIVAYLGAALLASGVTVLLLAAFRGRRAQHPAH
jgi:hypothetical protein